MQAGEGKGRRTLSREGKVFVNLTSLHVSPEFWDRLAPWYERWASRGRYHQPIVGEISKFCEPGWRILDIGAATGTLAIPLAGLGCRVDALEPSSEMLRFMMDKLQRLDLHMAIHPLPCTWESFVPTQETYDVILACNSLHLTRGGLRSGLEKIFDLGSRYVLLITEIGESIFIDFKALHESQQAYDFMFIKTLELDSSFYFASQGEAEEVRLLLGTDLEVLPCGTSFIQRDRATAATVLWERKGMT